MFVTYCTGCKTQIWGNTKACPECGLDKSNFKQSSDIEYVRIKAGFDIAGPNAKGILLSTTEKIQGKEISEHLGLVSGSGNSAWTLEGSAERANTALEKAERQIRSHAAKLGADGVVGIIFSLDGGQGAVSKAQSITLIGTAVKFE